MKAEDKDKLNKCLEILDSTDLGLSLVWLWTWNTIKNFMDDNDSWRITITEQEAWDNLCEAVTNGKGFSLEYGAEQHYEDVMDWMQDNGYMVDTMFNDDEEKQNDGE